MIRHINAVMRGEFSLARTFWLYFVILSMASQFLISTTILVINGYADFLGLVYWYFFYSVIISGWVITLAGALAVYEAANHHGSKLMANLTRLAVVIIVLSGAFLEYKYALNVHKVQSDVLKTELSLVSTLIDVDLSSKNLAENMDQATPKYMGGGLTVSSVSEESGIILIQYTVDQGYFAEASLNQIYEGLILTCANVEDIFKFESVSGVHTELKIGHASYLKQFSRSECV